MNGWAHKVWRNVLEARYHPTTPPIDDVTGDVLKERLCEVLAQYFSSKWSELAKPFQYSKRQLKRSGLLNPYSEVLRFVPKHSTIHVHSNARGDVIMNFNQRKLTVLLDVYMTLIRSNIDSAVELLEDFTKLVLFDYETLYALLKTRRYTQLLDAQELCAIAIPPQCEQELMRRELFLFSEFLIQDMEYMNQNSHCFGAHLLAQCVEFYGLLPHLTAFIDSVDSAGREQCALLPTAQQVETCVSRAQCRISEHVGPVRAAVCTEMFIYSLSERLIATKYELSGYTTLYNKLLCPPADDYFRTMVAAQAQWEAVFAEGEDAPKDDNLILYLLLANRPHIYVVQGSNGSELRVIKCEKIIRELSADVTLTVSHVTVVGNPKSAAHLLVVFFQTGAFAIVHSATLEVIYKDFHKKSPIIAHFDLGFFNGCHVTGFCEASGYLTWFCWNRLPLDMVYDNPGVLFPKVKGCSVPRMSADVSVARASVVIENLELRTEFSSESRLRRELTQDSQTNLMSSHVTEYTESTHLLVALSDNTVMVVCDVVTVTFGKDGNSLKISDHLDSNQTFGVLPNFPEQVKVICGKMSLTQTSEHKSIICACATTRDAHLILFDRKLAQASVTHSFERTFDDVILRSGILIGSFGSCMELFSLSESELLGSIVVQRLVELDEQRGPLTQICASSTSGGEHASDCLRDECLHVSLFCSDVGGVQPVQHFVGLSHAPPQRPHW